MDHVSITLPIELPKAGDGLLSGKRLRAEEAMAIAARKEISLEAATTELVRRSTPVAVRSRPGTLICHGGNFVHAALPNRRDRGR